MNNEERPRLQKIIYVYWMHFIKLCFGSYPMKDTSTKEEKMFSRMLGVLILAFFAVLLIIGIKEKPNEIGDAFNGLFGPVIAILGGYLVYRSFVIQTKSNRLQIKSNRIIQSQWIFERNLSILNEIKNSHEKIKFSASSANILHGKSAINIAIHTNSLVEISIENFPVFKEWEYIFIELTFLLQRLKEVDYENKRYIWLKIDLFYEGELQTNINNFQKRYGNKVDNRLFFDLNAEINKFLTIFNERFSDEK